MTLEIKDLTGFAQPITKLIEVVSAAVGSVFRPMAIKSEADAKAYEIKVLAQANAEAAVISNNIEISAKIASVAALAEAHPEIAERAKQRLLLREIEGQLNVEAIANNAVQALPAAVSDEPVGSDWRRKFFAEAENVCEQDMQIIWGKVLAGEVSSPGSFCLRTLDALRHISKHEAELFRKACGLAMNYGWIAIPGNEINRILSPFELDYSDILVLRDAGLLMDGNDISRDFAEMSIEDRLKNEVLFYNNGLFIKLTGPGLVHLKLKTLLFTRAGTELQKLVEPAPSEEYFRALGVFLRGRAVVAKRGVSVPQSDGSSVIVFDEDL